MQIKKNTLKKCSQKLTELRLYKGPDQIKPVPLLNLTSEAKDFHFKALIPDQ